MKIIGTGSALPEKVVDNDMLTQYFDTSDEWITTRTGIKTRRLCTTETLIDLGTLAAQRAIENAGIEPTDLDYLIVSNVANNYVSPSMGCVVQGRIGATCPTFDLNGACTGFIYALDIAEAFLKTGRCQHILILCAESPSKYCDWRGGDRSTSILFGDGAGAVVLTQGEDLLSIRTNCSSLPDVLWYKRSLEPTPFEIEGVEKHIPLQMNGKGVFFAAVAASCKDMTDVLATANIPADAVDIYLLHQANLRIIQAIRKHVKQPEEKFPTNLERCGNTSSASIPILMDELHRQGRLKPGMTLALSAFGAGFVSGAAILKWSKEE